MVARDDEVRAIVVMGVTGCGKTTIAEAIAQRTGARMIEGDAFHPPANVRKMSAGIALDDADRQGWLEQLGDEVRYALASSDHVVLTCSALKRRYRDTLRAAVPSLGFVFLELSRETAMRRVGHRKGHFMPASLVDSQFRDLEPPRDEPNVLTVDGEAAIDSIVDDVVSWWLR